MLSVLAISVGASVGALARWGLGVWLSQPGSLMLWGTLVANLAGAYLIGACIALFQALPQLDSVWRLLLITGFLGALTTFSTFSAEVVSFLMEGRYGLASLTAGLHVSGSLLMTVAGLKSMAWLMGHRLT